MSRCDIGLAQGNALLDFSLNHKVADQAGNADALLDGAGPESFGKFLWELKSNLHRRFDPRASATTGTGRGFLGGLMGRHRFLT